MRHEKCITYSDELGQAQAVAWDESKEKLLQRGKDWVIEAVLSMMGLVEKIMSIPDKKIKQYSIEKGWCFFPVIGNLMCFILKCLFLYAMAMIFLLLCFIIRAFLML